MSSSWKLSGRWLGLAVVLTTATQLRPGIPVGPGELMLAVWMLVTAGLIVARGTMAVPARGSVFLVFWIGSLGCLLAGWLAGILTNHSADSAIRDFLAYSVAAGTVLLVVLKPGGLEEVRAAGPVALFVGTLSLALLLVLTFPAGSIGPLTPWYHWRFRGWSENPNQVALLMIAVPFLAIHGMRRSQRRVVWAGYLMLLPSSVAVGIACASDGLLLGWVAGAIVMVFHSWLLTVSRGRAPLVKAAFLYVIVPLVALGSLAFVARPLSLRVEAVLKQLYYQQGGQGSLRLTLWYHGLQAMATSPLFGLGPGSHSGVVGPFGDMEAHNLFVDWGTATGVAGMLLLGILLVRLVLTSRTHPALLAALTAVVVFGISGYHVRHPVFWLYLLYISVTGWTESREGGANGEAIATPVRAGPNATPVGA